MFDFAWEGRLVLISGLLLILIVLVILRSCALRRCDYKWKSLRGFSTICVFGVLILGVSYLLTNVYYYFVTISIRAVYEETDIKLGAHDPARVTLFHMLGKIWKKRKKYAFAARVWTITMLWLAKTSFLLVYFEIWTRTTRKAKFFLCITAGSILLSYLGMWIAMGVHVGKLWFFEDLFRVSHSYLILGYGVTSENVMDLLLFDTYLDGLFWWEVTVGILNICTDMLLAITAYFIFSSLRNHRHVLRAEFFLIILCGITVSLACARVGVLSKIQLDQAHFHRLELQYSGMNSKTQRQVDMLMLAAWNTTNAVRPLRLAATVLTESEAYTAGAVICIPALRVLFRQSRRNSGGDSEEDVSMTDDAVVPAIRHSIRLSYSNHDSTDSLTRARSESV